MMAFDQYIYSKGTLSSSHSTGRELFVIRFRVADNKNREKKKQRNEVTTTTTWAKQKNVSTSNSSETDFCMEH